MAETGGATANNRDSRRMMGALPVYVGQGWWRSFMDEACEHERAKTIKRTHRDERSISAPLRDGTAHPYGVGGCGPGRQGAVVSSTDEKDEICVRKN